MTGLWSSSEQLRSSCVSSATRCKQQAEVFLSFSRSLRSPLLRLSSLPALSASSPQEALGFKGRADWKGGRGERKRERRREEKGGEGRREGDNAACCLQRCALLTRARSASCERKRVVVILPFRRRRITAYSVVKECERVKRASKSISFS